MLLGHWLSQYLSDTQFTFQIGTLLCNTFHIQTLHLAEAIGCMPPKSDSSSIHFKGQYLTYPMRLSLLLEGMEASIRLAAFLE